MKAKTQYSDLIGSVAVDIKDDFKNAETFLTYAEYFKLDKEKYTVVGITINGTSNFWISLICIDKEKSNETKEHIVKVNVNLNDDIESKKEILFTLFDKLQIVLYDKFDKNYLNLEIDEEIISKEN